jgi:hypothetical protein
MVTPAAASEVTYRSHVVGRLEGHITHFPGSQIPPVKSAVKDLLREARRAVVDYASMPDLVLGILTVPIPIRHPDQRTYQRAAHYSQPSVAAGRVIFRYLVSEEEVSSLRSTADMTFQMERAKYNDFVKLPAVPRRLRGLFKTPPSGSGCVLKILAWLEFASSSTAPWQAYKFIGYTDDDSFWALGRVEETLSMLYRAGAAQLPLYAGAMAYVNWWDFTMQGPKDWFWSLPRAARDFEREFAYWETSQRARLSSSYRLNASLMGDLSHPYAFAHGLGVVLSEPMVTELLFSTRVKAFMELYAEYAASPRMVAGEKGKCRLGGDSTIGLWISFMPQVLAVELTMFQANWPWPLQHRCHGEAARSELQGVNVFHLFGNEAVTPYFWLFLLNVTSDDRRWDPHPPLQCLPGASAVSRSLLERMRKRGAIGMRPHGTGWLNIAISRRKMNLERAADWLFCSIPCRNITGQFASGCDANGTGWPEFR